ncbi:MAG: threonine--tRNA ligase [Deltaproteobacteria bacterium]|nr:threonine--tRNA ligase [Deltaproteobacteria bacterium]
MTSLEGRKSVKDLLAERGLFDPRVIAARVGDEIRDLHTLVAADSSVVPIHDSDPEAIWVLRHSAAHILADAVQRLHPGTQVTFGPAVEGGFYYDFDRPEGPFTDEDLPKIESAMKKTIARDLPFAREETSRDAARALFESKGEKYKREHIDDIPEGETITLYRHGDWVDLCEGPHVPSTGWVRAVKLTSVAGAYWRGDAKNRMLSRIYGTAFFSKEDLDAHLARIEEAKRRDHRRLGKELDLYSIDETIGGGLVLWHPKGAFVRHLIEDYWRRAHLEHGYDLVASPHIARTGLWQISGHLGFYADRMYSPMDVEGTPYIVKPMNCPFHITIYKDRLRSYRELPLRWAELGTVYRFEQSGELHGLLRVRGFTQDDAHLFIRPEQIETELVRVVRFVLGILRAFGFTEFDVELSTRPEKFVGLPENWDRAEAALRAAIDSTGLPCGTDVGGGAFYGPKIDIKIKDCLGRAWQCSTVQLDFALPERFEMEYVGDDGKRHRPVMIHRALLGSIERFFAVMVEHYAGAFPMWLAPEQVALVTVGEAHSEYAREVAAILQGRTIRATVDDSSSKLGAKIRSAVLRKVPYVVVIGDKEVAARSLSPRSREAGDQGSVGLDAFVERVVAEARPPRLEV